jgi:hypothetical protein
MQWREVEGNTAFRAHRDSEFSDATRRFSVARFTLGGIAGQLNGVGRAQYSSACESLGATGRIGFEREFIIADLNAVTLGEFRLRMDSLPAHIDPVG